MDTAGKRKHYNALLHCLQVREFQGVASEFLQRLKTTGPGLPNTDLSKGLELLKKFQVTHAQCPSCLLHTCPAVS